MRGLLLALALGALAASAPVRDAPGRSGCHPTIETPLLRANLDRDRALEEVSATNVSCAHEYAYRIADACAYHTERHWLRGVGLRDELRVLDANGVRDGRELFYVLRRGAHRAPDLGTAAIVHLVRYAPDRCPTPRSVFLYSAAEPPLLPPTGFALTGFDVSVVELSSRYAGREVRLTETFGRTGETTRRETRFRYSRRADRYVIYSARL